MRVLVTGASGFVAAHLLPALIAAGYDVVAASRSPIAAPDVGHVRSPELGPDADYSGCLRGIDVVVHLAGRAHVPSEKCGLAVEELYQRINADGTRSLARQASVAGVRQFVFVSSCHAVAAESDAILTVESVPNPASPYGRSKLAAEIAVREEFSGAGLSWTILRPPLVYGPGNRANFDRLMKIARCGPPLPLGAVANRRSFIYAGNLADCIVKCLGNAGARQQIFFPSDGNDVSTPELIRLLADAMGQKARLFSVPPSLLNLAGILPGFGALRKLAASLFVDDAPARERLGWRPPFSMRQGLAAACPNQDSVRAE